MSAREIGPDYTLTNALYDLHMNALGEPLNPTYPAPAGNFRVAAYIRRVLAAEPVCPACGGDGRIPDRTGGGHHGTCKTCGGTGKVAK